MNTYYYYSLAYFEHIYNLHTLLFHISGRPKIIFIQVDDVSATDKKLERLLGATFLGYVMGLFLLSRSS